jgi:D-glycero-D-manno-heptose 1,7-bisphosphate phosphatase
MNMKRAIVFDRDGTLMEHVDYPSRPEQVRLVDGVELLREIHREYLLFLHTNQSGVPRGLMTATDCRSVQREFIRQLGWNPFAQTRIAHEAPGDEGPDSYRKPSPRFIHEISEEFCIDPRAITMIGDSECDALAAKNAGAKSILIRSPRNGSMPPDVDSLEEALSLL